MSRTGRAKSPLLEVAPVIGSVAGVALDYARGERIDEHRHDTAQLIYAVRGAMTVIAESGRWVVPTLRAVWVPAGVPHAIELSGAVKMRTVYVRGKEARRLFRRCSVVQVDGLLREIVLRIVAATERKKNGPAEARVVRVFFDELRAAPQMPLHLPYPRDARLRRVADALKADPACRHTLAQLARKAGGGERTLSRLFVSETGMTFGEWRQQLRLLAGLERLAAGDSVTVAALETGYESTSAFIAMFRRATGTTPARYFSSSGGATGKN